MRGIFERVTAKELLCWRACGSTHRKQIPCLCHKAVQDKQDGSFIIFVLLNECTFKDVTIGYLNAVWGLT